MRSKLALTSLVTLVLFLSLVVTAAAQTTAPTLSIGPGATEASGSVDPVFVTPGQTYVAIVANPHPNLACAGPFDPSCELLGIGTVNADGSWNVTLSRSAAYGECVEVYFSFDNQATWQLWFGCAETAPLLIPEPATLALVGAGLAGLAGYARRRRSRGAKAE